jgi:peptidyl-tRNA hydrolase, PTH1 family
VIHWVLKKPSLDDRVAIDTASERALKAIGSLMAGDMDKAMLAIHTHKPPRPKPVATTATPILLSLTVKNAVSAIS